jgi:hypothetical protein
MPHPPRPRPSLHLPLVALALVFLSLIKSSSPAPDVSSSPCSSNSARCGLHISLGSPEPSLVDVPVSMFLPSRREPDDSRL